MDAEVERMARPIDSDKVTKAQEALDRGCTYAAAARAAGVSARTISNWRKAGHLVEGMAMAAGTPPEGNPEGTQAGSPEVAGKRHRTFLPARAEVPPAKGAEFGAAIGRKEEEAALLRAELDVRQARRALQDDETRRTGVDSASRVARALRPGPSHAPGQAIEAGIQAFRQAASHFGVDHLAAWRAANEVRCLLRASSPRIPPFEVFLPVLERLVLESRIQKGSAMLNAELDAWNWQADSQDRFESGEVAHLQRRLEVMIRKTPLDAPLKSVVERLASLAKDNKLAAREFREEAEAERREQASHDEWVRGQTGLLEDLVREKAEELDLSLRMDASWNIDAAKKELRSLLQAPRSPEDTEHLVADVACRYLKRVEAGEFS